ncbi:MAG: rubredoxin [Nitrospiraceae bacterium]|nr:rubredoxin [Nitrospiraceae bacterium]
MQEGSRRSGIAASVRMSETAYEYNPQGENVMWQCQRANCGYIYDPKKGDRKGKIPPGTRFEDLPDDWTCPLCGAGKHMFKRIDA